MNEEGEKNLSKITEQCWKLYENGTKYYMEKIRSKSLKIL